MRWVGTHGYEVRRIILDGRERLRVTQYGYVVTYARSAAEVARWVDLAGLVEVTELRAYRKERG